MLIQRGYISICPYEFQSKEKLYSLTKKLTKVHFFNKKRVGTTTNFKYEKEDGRSVALKVPRMLPFELLRKYVRGDAEKMSALADKIPKPRPQLAEYFIGELTHNQQVIRNHLTQNYFNDRKSNIGRSSAYIKWGTGHGKTYLSIGIISSLQVKTLVVVPNSYLLNQYYEDIWNCYDALTPDGNRTIKIGRIGDGHKLADFKGYDVVIGIINSLLKFTEHDFRHFELTIFDEAHSYCSDERAHIFWNAQSRYNFAMSATPERTDGNEFISYQHIGEPIDATTIPDYDDDEVEFQGSVKAIMYDGLSDYTETQYAGENKSPILTSGLISEDPVKNALIVDEIVKLLISKDRKIPKNIFVFSERREHLDVLENLLLERKDELDDECQVVTETDKKSVRTSVLRGGVKQDVVDSAKAKDIQRSVIFTTYGYGSTGVSIVRMNALIVASSRKTFTQAFGRILRRGSDTSIPRLVIDFIDNATFLASQYKSRRSAYKMRDFNINYYHYDAETLEYNDVPYDQCRYETRQRTKK